MQKAVVEILNLELTPLILERFGWNEEALQALDERPKTWVHLAVLQVVGEEDLVAERLQMALEFHRSVSDQAAAHLNRVRQHLQNTRVSCQAPLHRQGPGQELSCCSGEAFGDHQAWEQDPFRESFDFPGGPVAEPRRLFQGRASSVPVGKPGPVCEPLQVLGSSVSFGP